MTTNEGFTDPYEDEDKKVRLQTWVSELDHDTVTSIRPGKGTIKVVNNKLWFEFCKALKRSGVTGLEHKVKFEHLVAGIRVSFEKKGK